MIDGCHEDAELCDIAHLKKILDPIATRDTDCTTSSSTSSEGPQGSTSANTGSSEAEQPTLLSLSATTGTALFVTLVLLSGVGGSALTFTIMRRRFNSAMDNRRVDFGGAWSIDDGDDDDHGGLELTEGGNLLNVGYYDTYV